MSLLRFVILMKIGLLSDTHGYLDQRIIEHFNDCDEIWHAGDFGSMEVVHAISSRWKLRGVHGNIDDPSIRSDFPVENTFELDGLKVYLTHIGGYPPIYTPLIRKKLDLINPDLFICGHSHIIRIMKDQERKILHINPGAAGMQGFHKIRSIVRLEIRNREIKNLQVIELGKRA